MERGSMTNTEFNNRLQQEAKMQKKLLQTQILPENMSFLTRFIGEKPVISLGLLSVLTAACLELVRYALN